MILKTDTVGEIVVAKVEIPQLDIQTTKEFREASVCLASTRHVVLDLHAVEFIDSTGLGALLSLLRRLKLEGGDLRLTGIGSQVLSIFRLVRMNKVFAIFPSVEEAVASFSWPARPDEHPPLTSDDSGYSHHGLGDASECVQEP